MNIVDLINQHIIDSSAYIEYNDALIHIYQQPNNLNGSYIVVFYHDKYISIDKTREYGIDRRSHLKHHQLSEYEIKLVHEMFDYYLNTCEERIWILSGSPIRTYTFWDILDQKKILI